jgi:long-chain fatty acid transport protein
VDRLWKGFLGALILALLVTPAEAGGLWLYEMGTPDLGTASAGRAALAQDASTAFCNPAGMTRLDRSQLLGAFQMVLPSIRFQVDQRSTCGPGGETGNAGLSTPGLSGFYVHKLSPNWRLGLSLLSYLDLGANYGDGWAGRYYLQASKLVTVSCVPSAAYRVNDWLSLGAGFILMYGKLRQASAINNLLPPGAADGRISFNSDALGYGGLAGVLLEPRPGTRLGVSYISPVELPFKDVASLGGAGPILRDILQKRGLWGKKVDLTYTLPQQVMFSVYQQITGKLALMANFGWQNWSQFGQVRVTIDSDTPKDLTADAHLRDTWHGAVGLQYRLAPPWLLSLGFAYDSSAASKAHRTPATAIDRQLRYACGLQYDWNENVTLGLAYEFMDAGPAPIDINRGPLAGTLAGEYSANYFHFIATNIIWKF